MEKIDWLKILRFLTAMIFWAAIAAIPLGMSFFFPVMSPFSSVKSAMLAILGSGIAILAILSLRLWRGYGLESRIISKRVGALAPVWIAFAAFALLSIFSVNPAQSWFGSYERHFGLLAYFWIFFWFSFGAIKLSSSGIAGWLSSLKVFSSLTAIVGVIISIYSFLQFCGIDFVIWQEPQILSRAIGTFGQPNFLGSFLIMAMPITAYLSYIFGRRARVFALVALLMQAVGVIVSGSRSAWLGLIVVGAVCLVIAVWRKYRYKALGVGALAVALALAALFFAMPQRMASLTDLNQGSPALRRYFYEAGLEAVLAKPWFGVGLENGGEAMISAYEPDWGIFMVIDGYTDKAHNSILDIAIQMGLIGLLFWSAIYIFVAWQVVRLYRHKEGRHYALAAGSALSAYGISILFGLSDIPNSFFFWIIAATVVAGNLVLDPVGVVKVKDYFLRRSLGAVLTVFVLALSLGQIVYSLGNLQADYYFLQLKKSLIQRDYFTSATLYSYLSSSAFNPAHREYYQRSFASQLLASYEEIEDGSSRQLVSDLLRDIRGQISSAGAENLIVSARLDCHFDGQGHSAPLYESAISLSPNRPLAYRERAACRAKGGDVEGALADYSKALSLLPSVSDERLNHDHLSYLRYYAAFIEKERAELFSSEGKLSEALASYKEAYSRNPHDIGLYLPISRLLVEMHRMDDAERTLQHAYLRQPSQYQWPLALAELRQRSGDRAGAMEYARQASALAPADSLPLVTAPLQ